MLERLNLSKLKDVDLSQLKSMSNSALKSMTKLGKKRMKVAGFSVAPWIIGGIAAVAVGTYFILRNRNNSTAQLAGATGMEGQEYPVK